MDRGNVVIVASKQDYSSASIQLMASMPFTKEELAKKGLSYISVESFFGSLNDGVLDTENYWFIDVRLV